MADEKLKPCPFCGGKAFLFDGDFEGTKIYRVICRDKCCCMQGKIYLDKEEAVSAWNRRASDEN